MTFSKLTAAVLTITLPPAVSAQVRHGGVYEISAEALDAGGGPLSGGVYQIEAAELRTPAGSLSGGVYALSSGFTGQLGSTGAGCAAFALWQTLLFGSPAAMGAGAGEDPDRDGVVNLLEFAFNLDPFTASHRPVTAGTGTSGTPLIREETLDGQAVFTVEYIQRKNCGEWRVETSADLAAWAPAAVTLLSGPVAVSPAYERVKVKVNAPIGTGAERFVRLAVRIGG